MRTAAIGSFGDPDRGAGNRYRGRVRIRAAAISRACDWRTARCRPPRDERLPAAFQRQAVFYRTNEPVGTIIVDTVYRYLYLVQENSRAIRYGIGVGREGFEWQGLLRIVRKAEWPDWTPSPDVIKRQPQLPRFMKGGPGNPLGARALFLGEGYRIHGTNQPQTIGNAVFAGCYRLTNADIIDLYPRVSVGDKGRRAAKTEFMILHAAASRHCGVGCGGPRPSGRRFCGTKPTGEITILISMSQPKGEIEFGPCLAKGGEDMTAHTHLMIAISCRWANGLRGHTRRKLLKEKAEKALALRGVLALEFGKRTRGGRLTDELAIVVTVERKLPPEALPKQEDLRALFGADNVDVVQASPLQALFAAPGYGAICRCWTNWRRASAFRSAPMPSVCMCGGVPLAKPISWSRNRGTV